MEQKYYVHKYQGVVILITVLIIISLSWLATIYFLEEDANRGTFGDMFGSVNALFSGFALAGIIYTIWMQSKELKLQREELRLTRNEFENQNETFRLQRFENTFFNLLAIHHQIIDSLDDTIKTWHLNGADFNEYSGRDVFDSRYDDFLLKIKIPNDFGYRYNAQEYLNYWPSVQTNFGHYFRNLYRIIKLIDETEFYKDDPQKDFKYKYKYTSMVRAQLSDYELIWICWNCMSDLGKEKFKPLVEKYLLLKNLMVFKVYEMNIIACYPNHKEVWKKENMILI